MKGWRSVELAEVCAISSALVDPRLPEYRQLLHVGGANIESHTGRLFDVKTAEIEQLVSGKYLFDNGSVLYSKIRPYLVKVARPAFSGLCSADIYPLSTRPHLLDRDFLYYLLLTQDFTEYAVKGSARAGMPKVNRDHLFAYRCLLPPLVEQRRIAGILDEAFAGIATAQANTERNLRNSREVLESHVRSTLDSRDNPWPVVSLVDLCDLFVDSAHRTPHYQPDGIPTLRPRDVVNGVLAIDSAARVSGSEYDIQTKRHRPSAGDIVYSRELSYGWAAVLPASPLVCLS